MMRYYINKLLLLQQVPEAINLHREKVFLWSFHTISSWPHCFGAYEMEHALAACGETTLPQGWERAKCPASVLNPLFPQ